MKTPSEFQVNQLFHALAVKAPPPRSQAVTPPSPPPTPVSGDPKTQQRKDLAAAIQKLESQLRKLDALIAQRASSSQPANSTAQAKKERAAKEMTKPQKIADQANAVRRLKKSQGKSVKHAAAPTNRTKDPSSNQPSLDELKALATRVRGEIAVAKQKLAAL